MTSPPTTSRFGQQNVRQHKRPLTQQWMPLLVLLLGLKILGFFTLSKSVAITRVLKVVIRSATTGAVFLMLAYLRWGGYLTVFTYRNTLAAGFYLLYFLLGFASLMWSTDVGYSMLQLVMDVETLIFVMIYLQLIVALNFYYPEKPVHLDRVFAQAVFLIMAMCIIGMLVNPDLFYRLTHGGEVARLGGYLMNPNELGMLAVVGIACDYMSLSKERGNKLFCIFRILIALWALVLTGSRSSMIGFALVTLYMISGSRSYALKFVVVSGMVLAIPFVVNVIFLKQGDLEEVLSMTGRLPFWKALLSEGLPKEPWFGFGFMRISHEGAFKSADTYAASMTHNTFIQILMNLGFVGFGICVMQMILTFRAAILSRSSDHTMFFICVLIPILINSFTEFGIFGETNYGIMFYQFLIFVFVVQFRKTWSAKEKIKLNLLFTR